MSIFNDEDRLIRFKPMDLSKFRVSSEDIKYLSPIKVIMQDMAQQIAMDFDNNVVKAVQSYAIDVDKDELFKALAYDRDQYNKGFADGFKAGKKDRWITFPGPDIPGKYIVTYESGEVGRCYWGSLKGVFCWQRLGKDITHEVLAWMENPEPYKEEPDNEKD